MSAFPQFPKTRPALPPALERLHARTYEANRQGETTASSLSLMLERWLHRQVAADVTGGVGSQSKTTLEIGAGTLNQLPHEPVVGPYDIVEPFRTLYFGSPLLTRVRTVYADIAEVPASARYDRITSTATFEHLTDLPRVVAAAGRLLAPDGALRVAIPSEGTPLWTLGWKLTTGLEFRLKHGLDYGLLLRHEHVNTAREIEAVLRHYFADLRARVFGLSRSLSFYQFFECRGPHVERCRQQPSKA